MKTIKLFATISLLILAPLMMTSSTFAQAAKTKTFTYYVNVHLSVQQSYTERYLIEIWDQYGFRVLASKTSVPGQHVYVFQETVPVSVTSFTRVARIFFLPSSSTDNIALRANPDVISVLYPGNWYFNLYPIGIPQQGGKTTIYRQKNDNR